MSLAEQLDAYVRQHPFSTLSIHSTTLDGQPAFQANLRVDDSNSFRVRVESTPSAALTAVLVITDQRSAVAPGVFD